MEETTRRRILQSVFGIVASAGIADSAVASTPMHSTAQQGFEPELIEKDEEAGFNFPYFLYAPENGRNKPVLVECVNSGFPSDDLQDHIDAAERTIQSGLSRDLCDELGVPFLVPVIKDPVTGEASDSRTQSLDTEAMQIEEGRFARIDKQVVAMVDDARDRLADYGYELPEEFMLNGFSQSGNFANNLAFLQPERVASVTAGGLNGMAILPKDEAAGEHINFQIGTGDYETLTGNTFDKETWREIPQLGYIGANERIPFDDTIPYSDVWTDREQAERAVDVYGSDMQLERMVYSDLIHQQAGANTRFEVYDNAGHDNSAPEIVRDTLVFAARSIDVPYSTVVRGLVAGAEEIELEVFVPSGNSDTQEVRAFVHGADASEEPVAIRRGEANRITLSLTSPLELDDTVEFAVFNPGDTDIDDALHTDPREVSFEFAFNTPPEPGETSVEIEYEVSDSTTQLQLYLLTDNGSLYWQRQTALGVFGGNESGTETVEFSRRDEGLPFESGDELELQASLPGEPRQLRSVVDTVTVGDPDTYDPETQCLENVSHDDLTIAFRSPPTVNSRTIEIECAVDAGFDEPVHPRLFPDIGAGRWGITDDWNFEDDWKSFDTVSPGSSIEEAYDVPIITFAPADSPALGASVELRAYPESWLELDDYVASDCAPISGVRFTEPPMAGTDAVDIRYLYPDTFEQPGQLQLQVNGKEVETVDGISPGTLDDQTLAIGTSHEIEPDDDITVTIGPEGETPFDKAQEIALPADAGMVAFASDVEALDRTVTLDYHLDPDFETERFATLRLYTEATSEWGVLLGRVDPGANAEESFEINPDEVCVPFAQGTELTVALVNWNDPYATLPMATTTATVGEEVPEIPRFEVDISVEGEGTTSPEPGNQVYLDGDTVSIEAIPETGWEFAGWGGDIEHAGAEIEFTIEGDTEVVAEFERQKYELEIVVEGAGTTDPEAGQHTVEFGDEIEIEATPDTGLEFHSWSGDVESEAATITVTVEEDMEIIANFSQGATATPTPTPGEPTPTPTPSSDDPTPTPLDDDGIPGPGIVGTVGSLVGAGYVLNWWRDKRSHHEE